MNSLVLKESESSFGGNVNQSEYSIISNTTDNSDKTFQFENMIVNTEDNESILDPKGIMPEYYENSSHFNENKEIENMTTGESAQGLVGEENSENKSRETEMLNINKLEMKTSGFDDMSITESFKIKPFSKYCLGDVMNAVITYELEFEIIYTILVIVTGFFGCLFNMSSNFWTVFHFMVTLTILILVNTFLSWHRKRKRKKKYRKQMSPYNQINKGYIMKKFLNQIPGSRNPKIAEVKVEDYTENSYSDFNIQDTTLKQSGGMGKFKTFQTNYNMRLGKNEVSLSLVGPRPFIDVTTEGGIVVPSLLDSGATSCSVQESLLEKIEESLGYKLPRLGRKFSVSTYGTAKTLEQVEIVIMSIWLSKDTAIANVPFLIAKGDDSTPLILGTNLMISKRFILAHGPSSCLVTFKTNAGLNKTIRANMNKNDVFPLTTLHEMTILPKDELHVPLSLDAAPKMLHNLTGKSGMIIPNEQGEGLFVSSLSILDSKNQVFIKLLNTTGTTATLVKGAEVASFSICPSTFSTVEEVSKMNDFVIKQEMYAMYAALPKKRLDCICRLQNDPNSRLVFLANKFGQTLFRDSVNHEHRDVHTNKDLGRIVTINQKETFFLENSRGHYDNFDNKNLREKFNQTTQKFNEIHILISHNQVLDPSAKSLICDLFSLPPRVHLYFVKNTDFCRECSSIGTDDLVDYIKSTRILRLHVHNAPTQLPGFELMKDQNSPLRTYQLMGGSRVQIFRWRTVLNVVIHISNVYVSKFYIKNVAYSVLEQLRQQGVSNVLIITCSDRNVETSSASGNLAWALKQLKPFQPRIEAMEPKGEKLFPLERIPFYLEKCSCMACNNIHACRVTPEKKSFLVFEGKIEEFDKNIRYDMGKTNIQMNTTEMEEVWEEASDIDEIEGGEELKQAQEMLEEFPINHDPIEIINSRHVVKPWRNGLDPMTLPESHRSQISALLDKYEGLLAHTSYEWRFLDLPEVQLRFTNTTPIVDKPFMMNAIQSAILDFKIGQLIDASMVEILEDTSEYMTNLSRVFLVPLNSKENRALKNTSRREINSSFEVIELLAPKFRLVIDLRTANRFACLKTYLDWCVRPTIESFSKLHGFSVCTLLDVSKSYRSVKVDKASQYGNAFYHPQSEKYGCSVFSMKSLPDGNKNSVGIYSKIIQEMLGPELLPCVISHVDDLCVLGVNEDDCLQKVEILFQKAEKINMLFGIKKIQFLKTEFDFLGQRVELRKGSPVISVSQEKKAQFATFQIPTSKVQLQRVLGCAAYIAHHCPGLYAKITPLLDALKIKERKDFHLDELQVKNFHHLLELLDGCQQLYVANTNREIFVSSDSSLLGWGGVAYQIVDEEMRIIKFASGKYPELIICGKSNTERELIALAACLVSFRQHIQMALRCTFIIDISALVSLLSASVFPSNSPVSRFSFRLFTMGTIFQLKHVAGHYIKIADTLSRKHAQSLTGMPLHTKEEVDRYFGEKLLEYPEHWNQEGYNITFSEGVNHLVSQIKANPKLSETLREKRLEGLRNNLKIPDIATPFFGSQSPREQTKVIRLRNEEGVTLDFHQPVNNQAQISTVHTLKLRPPTSILALTPRHLAGLQKVDPFCQKIIKTFTMTNKEDIPKKYLKRFRVLDNHLLIGRKDLKKPFEDQSNLRIIAPETGISQILCYLHLTGHHGVNNLINIFANNFMGKQVTNNAKVVVKSCRACQLYTISSRAQRPAGRITHNVLPHETMYIDDMHCNQGQLGGTTFKYLLGGVDAMSGFFWAIPMSSESVRNTIMSFQKLFCIIPPPMRIVSDSGPNLCANKTIREFLRSAGVKEVLTVAKYSSKSNSIIERSWATIRRLCNLNSEALGRTQWETLFPSIMQMNNRSLYHLRKYSPDKKPPTPYSLFFNRPVPDLISEAIESKIAPKILGAYREKYAKIIAEYDEEMKQKHELKHQNDRWSLRTKIGDLVFLVNKERSSKESPRYIRELYQILEVGKAKAKIIPLFNKTHPKPNWVNLNYIKPYFGSELLDSLPEEYKVLLGHGRSNEQIFKMKEQNQTPSVVLPKIPTPAVMKLRHRLYPESLHSKNAIKLRTNESEPSSTGTLSEESDSDSGLTPIDFRLNKREPLPNAQKEPIIGVPNNGPEEVEIGEAEENIEENMVPTGIQEVLPPKTNVNWAPPKEKREELRKDSPIFAFLKKKMASPSSKNNSVKERVGLTSPKSILKKSPEVIPTDFGQLKTPQGLKTIGTPARMSTPEEKIEDNTNLQDKSFETAAQISPVTKPFDKLAWREPGRENPERESVSLEKRFDKITKPNMAYSPAEVIGHPEWVSNMSPEPTKPDMNYSPVEDIGNPELVSNKSPDARKPSMDYSPLGTVTLKDINYLPFGGATGSTEVNPHSPSAPPWEKLGQDRTPGSGEPFRSANKITPPSGKEVDRLKTYKLTGTTPKRHIDPRPTQIQYPKENVSQDLESEKEKKKRKKYQEQIPVPLKREDRKTQPPDRYGYGRIVTATKKPKLN